MIRIFLKIFSLTFIADTQVPCHARLIWRIILDKKDTRFVHSAFTNGFYRHLHQFRFACIPTLIE